MDEIDRLANLLDSHREKAYITCEERCFCWDVVNFLNENLLKEIVAVEEESHPTGLINTTNKYTKCPHCGREVGPHERHKCSHA